MPIVSVQAAASQYQVVIDPGLLSRAGALLEEVSNSKTVAVVTDSHVGPLHLPALRESLQSSGFRVIDATIPAGEQHKTLPMLLPVYDQFLSAGMERMTPVLALGGGVVGDMAGFVAATILRGVPLVQCPTTLLAMVDASVGGKTGVDHAVGKNLIGAFHQPVAVLIDPEVLRTLPPRELRGGLAECIKHDLIRDAEHFHRLPERLESILQLDMPALTDLIAHNVAIKARVVQADPFEKGERAHLNFGHTFGHAIETISNYSYSHGESVALGMCAAAHVSLKLGLLDQAALQSIRDTIQRAGLPTGNLKLDADQVVESMHFDKKVKAGKIRFVLLEGIGRATVRDDIPPTLVREAVQSLL